MVEENQSTSIIDIVSDKYNDILHNLSDPRVDGWLFMSSPWPTLAICLTYVFIVKVAGPKFMKNRKPYDLRSLLVLYNAFQVLFSAWLFYEYGRGGWFHNYSFTCQPVDYSRSDMAMRMLHVCWWYYFSKYTEFFDTFFFVLRKKDEQVSLLHVIHHGCMPMSVWFGVKFTPGGHSTFFGLLNTFVHIIMYFYYMISAMGPRYSYLIWWKKYLTTIQMIQFIMISVHAFQLCFIECQYPKAFVWWIGLHGIFFLILFANFYSNAYKKAQLRRKERKSNLAVNGKSSSLFNGNAITNGKVYMSNGNGESHHANGNGSVVLTNGNGTYTNGHVDSNSNGIKLKAY